MSDVVTIHQNTDFRRVYGRGRSCSSPALVVYCLKTRAGVCRIGITTSKKLGGAVERNRCRRVIKEAYRHLSPQCVGGWDIVFVARFKTLHLKTGDVEAAMYAQLRQMGVIQT